MADAIDQTTNAAGTAEEVNANIPDDVFDDIDISDVEDTTDESTETTTEEESTDEAATETEDDTEEDSDTDVESEDSDETDDSNNEEQTEDTDNTKAQEAIERQKRNEEAAQRRIAEREAREQAKQEATNKQLNDIWENSYDQAINAGFDESQARLFASQALTAQQLTNDAYNNRVMQVTNNVTAELNNAVRAIPEFNSDNPVIKEAMLRAVDKFEAMHVVKDDNGDAVQVTGDVLAFLQSEAETIRLLTGLGAQQQEEAKNTQKKRTMAPPSRTPRKPKVDPDLAAFDAEASTW